MSTTRHQRSCLRTAARAAAVSLCSCTIASGKSTSTPSSVHTYAARARASSTYAEYASASSDRWASKALAVRGGIEEVTGEDSPWGGIPGAMSERRITLSSFNRILGDKLLVVEDPSKGTIQEISTKDTLQGKHVAYVFSSQALEAQSHNDADERANVPLIPVVEAAYKRAKEGGKELEVIYVPIGDSEETYMDALKDMPWKGIVYDDATVANLVRKTDIRMLPAVAVVDDKGEVLTSRGDLNMALFPDGFPWEDRTPKEMLGPKFIKPDGTEVGVEALEDKIVAVYFGASSCAASKEFTPILKEVYDRVQKAGKPFEVVFVSSDKTAEEYASHIRDMPWLSIPFDGRTRSHAALLLGTSALPSLFVFDENQHMITAEGRSEVMKDQSADRFPWCPTAVCELSLAPGVITHRPSFVVFMEGEDENEQARIRDLLEPIATVQSERADRGEVRPIGFVTASEIEQLSTALREMIGLSKVKDKYKFMKRRKVLLQPRLAFLDFSRNCYALSDEEELTEETVAAFVASWQEGELDMKEFEDSEPVDQEGKSGDGPLG